MKAYELMAKHLNKNEIELESTDCKCALCGNDIKKGVPVTKVVSGLFMDWAKFGFELDYLCLDCRSLFSSTALPEGKPLRRFNVYFSESKVEVLKEKEDIVKVLTDTPIEPFVFQYAFSQKKHAFWKARINYPNDDRVSVVSDKGIVTIDRTELKECVEVAKRLIEAKFSRTEIKAGESMKFNFITVYGRKNYEADMKVFEPIRKTLAIELVMRIV